MQPKLHIVKGNPRGWFHLRARPLWPALELSQYGHPTNHVSIEVEKFSSNLNANID